MGKVATTNDVVSRGGSRASDAEHSSYKTTVGLARFG